jgi:hypothetical protein
MQRIIWVVWIGLITVACQESENTSDFTGNEITYALQPGSEYNVSGTLADTGPGRDVVLAGGNIGESFTKSLTSGRRGDKVSYVHAGEIAMLTADIHACNQSSTHE